MKWDALCTSASISTVSCQWNNRKIENPTITLDTYVKSDECCLLHCITLEGTLIWLPKKVNKTKPGELTKISKTPDYQYGGCCAMIYAHERITPKVSYPPPQELNRGPKMGPWKHVNDENCLVGARKCSRQQNGDKAKLLCRAQSAQKGSKNEFFSKENKSQNGNKTELLSHRGKSKRCVHTDKHENSWDGK